MTRKVFITVSVLLAVMMLAGCGLPSEAHDPRTPSDMPAVETPVSRGIESGDLEEFRSTVASTVGKAMDYHGFDERYAVCEDMFVYVFTLDGITYRVFAHMSDEMLAEIASLDVQNHDYEERYRSVVAPLEIESFDNLTLAIPTQKDLDAFIGKTGEELLKDGWVLNGYNAGDRMAFMAHDAYNFGVHFGKENGGEEFAEDVEDSEFIRSLVISSIEYLGISRTSVNIKY